jgi:Myotubularin-like phosphatase domain
LPTLTFYDRVTGTSIWRSAQPTRLFFRKKAFDEDLIKLIGECNSNPNNLRGTVAIFDARPKINAQANIFRGGGTEDCGPGKAYPNC